MTAGQTPPTSSRAPNPPPGWRATIIVAIGLLGTLLFTQAVLESRSLSAAFASSRSWQSLVAWMGAKAVPGDPTSVLLPLSSVAGFVVPFFAVTLALGAWRLQRLTGIGLSDAVVRWADRGGRWWLIPGTWWLLSTVALISGWLGLEICLEGTIELWVSIALAGWMNSWFTLRDELKLPQPGKQWGRWLAAAVVASGVLFTALNWGLWFNLRVPHGDSAMYEEHLWNIEHGKGFRSYLDQGLFLGEHVQVIHLLLLPLHWIWPSQMLLELCQAFAMAAGAIPVYRLALMFSRSPRAALLLACAYLLYFPVQYLDLTIDLKTFRPNSLGVPALLYALHAWESGRKRACISWLLLMLSAQEDYAIVISLLGAWIVLNAGRSPGSAASPWSRAALRRMSSPTARSQMLFGLGLGVFGVVYLAIVMKVVFPYFRDGATIHYTTYFKGLGDTPGEIVWTILTRPDIVLGKVVTAPSIIYAAALLVPLGCLPLRSPGRLLTALPLFVLLCLNTLALQPPAPVHHFHAPLVPLLFWAAAAGLRPPVFETLPTDTRIVDRRARFACLGALATGLFMSITPLGLKFWDPGSPRYWQALYIPGARAKAFPIVDALIPQDARVASTDFVHARLTHRERSYDYSDYVRKVADYEDRVPGDTQWIVIDIEHPYHSAEEVATLSSSPFAAVRELRESPEEWQLVEHPASQYFVVLKRR